MIQRLESNLEKIETVHIIPQIANAKPKDHLILEYITDSELAVNISAYIVTAVKNNNMVLFVMPKSEYESILVNLKSNNTDLEILEQDGHCMKLLVEEMMNGSKLLYEFELLEDYLNSIIDFSLSERKKGMYVISTLASCLSSRNYLENALEIEREWEKFIVKNQFPISILCPYRNISNRIISELESMCTRIIHVN